VKRSETTNSRGRDEDVTESSGTNRVAGVGERMLDGSVLRDAPFGCGILSLTALEKTNHKRKLLFGAFPHADASMKGRAETQTGEILR